VITLAPPLIAAPSVFEQIAAAYAAVTDGSYEADLRYVRAVSDGQAACEDLALCYWAGQPFILDINTLRIITWAVPEIEDEYVVRMAACRFSLIQLSSDWNDPVDGPFTARVREALAAHYDQVRESTFASYWSPRCAPALPRPDGSRW
jgi:hypothetical protein